MDRIERFINNFKLRRIPKIVLDEIIDEEHSMCANCKFLYEDDYCKIMKTRVDPQCVCNEHVYAAKFLTHKYKMYQVEERKKTFCYRESHNGNTI